VYLAKIHSKHTCQNSGCLITGVGITGVGVAVCTPVEPRGGVGSMELLCTLSLCSQAGAPPMLWSIFTCSHQRLISWHWPHV